MKAQAEDRGYDTYDSQVQTWIILGNFCKQATRIHHQKYESKNPIKELVRQALEQKQSPDTKKMKPDEEYNFMSGFHLDTHRLYSGNNPDPSMGDTTPLDRKQGRLSHLHHRQASARSNGSRRSSRAKSKHVFMNSDKHISFAAPQSKRDRGQVKIMQPPRFSPRGLGVGLKAASTSHGGVAITPEVYIESQGSIRSDFSSAILSSQRGSP